ncbi:unnamed protein product, partial [Larinioides sclopetarius]
IRSENQDQANFCPFTLREVSVLAELALGHLRYLLTDVPPQSNFQPDAVFGADLPGDSPVLRRQKSGTQYRNQGTQSLLPLHRISKDTMKVVVFH